MFEVSTTFKRLQEESTDLQPGTNKRFIFGGRLSVESEDRVTLKIGPYSRTYTGSQIHLVDPFHLFPSRYTFVSWKGEEKTPTSLPN